MAINERCWHDTISGGQTCLGARLGRAALRAASWPYAAATGMRRWCYRRGWKGSYSAGAGVISVGNITTGGTGKTPLAVWVARRLGEDGRRPAILTRGYKAVEGVSDEAEMLKRLTGVPVIVNPDRLAGAKAAVGQGADVLIMDDGFQHLRLRRDLDIIVIDATCPFGYDAVLPRGLLREPAGALKDADVIVITRCDQADRQALSAIHGRLAALAPDAVLAESVMAPTALCGFDGGQEDPACLAGESVWAFCGLGNPEGFYRTLAGLGAPLAGRTSFNDHHSYSTRDVRRLHERASSALLVTTAKDAVKLAGVGGAADIRWLEVELAFRSGEHDVARLVSAAAG